MRKSTIRIQEKMRSADTKTNQETRNPGKGLQKQKASREAAVTGRRNFKQEIFGHPARRVSENDLARTE